MKRVLITGILIAMSFSVNAEKGELKSEESCNRAYAAYSMMSSVRDTMIMEIDSRTAAYEMSKMQLSMMDKGTDKYKRNKAETEQLANEVVQAEERLEKFYQKGDKMYAGIKKHCYAYFTFN